MICFWRVLDISFGGNLNDKVVTINGKLLSTVSFDWLYLQCDLRAHARTFFSFSCTK